MRSNGSHEVIGLGLESSCDETAASVVADGSRILSNIIFSQIDLHRQYYGVVPEIASRSHLEAINGLIDAALKEAGIGFERLDYVSATNRPGLVGSLLISLQSAKSISFALGIPLIAVNHLEAHLYAPFLEGRELRYPYIGLLVSGGNTVLYEVRGVGEMEVLGRTADDAAGEAFDKVAKFLDIGYPGGPAIEKLARTAVKKNIVFSKILTAGGETRFSYSGLKTAVVNYVKNNPEAEKSEIVYGFQESALEILARRTIKAAHDRSIRDIVVAGGVAANGRLRQIFEKQRADSQNIIFASPGLCTDNAAMAAGLAFRYYEKKIFSSLEEDVYARG
jgi:N6-L-threonylcarbamoyladenine synthase